MKVVLAIERRSFLLWGQIMTRDEGAKRYHLKMREPLKEQPKRKRVKSRSKSSSDRSTDEERSPSSKRWPKKSKKQHWCQEKEARKRKSIGDIHLCHHHQAHLMMMLMMLMIEAMRARKAQIPNLGWFLRRISINTAYLQIPTNTQTLILILSSKWQT